ncbi:MAG: phosphonate C-P lyase system protein PhnH, partial [Rhodospirillaceae bacterium]|nr:phosphonate C-P lyase system protein PhnH [Rhodospirillaceae bacterium]
QQVQANGAAFPLGVDLLLVGRSGWVGLPRSVAVEIA